MNALIKYIVSLQLLMLILCSSLALAEDFNFKFTFRGEVWNHIVKDNNKNSAFEIASQDCLNHFTKSSGQQKIKVDSDTADALINTCANPR